MKLACIGEAMVEVSLSSSVIGPAQISFAGDVLNTAVYAAREAPDLEVDFISAVGTDALSDAMVEFIAAQGVGTAHIERHPTRTCGLYSISRNEGGERSFAYWRNASAAREMVALGLPDLSGYDCIYFSAITLAILPPEDRITLLDAIKTSGATVAFDSNYRPVLWENVATAREAVQAAWAVTDIALPSMDDEVVLFGETAVMERIRSYGPHRGAIKRGEDGPLSIVGVEAGPFAPASKVVDTTAAGDSFNGAYLAAILTGATEADALKRGHTRASATIAAVGAIVLR